MKKHLDLILAAAALMLACIFTPLALTGCNTPPDSRVVAVQSLKAVGASAEASMQLAGQLYQAGKITSGQLIAVANFYDGKFQPTFRIAVLAANSDVTAIAPTDVSALATQLATLVASFSAR